MFSAAKTIGLPRTEAVAARILAKVRVDEHGCYIWTASTKPTHRGQRPQMYIRAIKRCIRVARLVLEWKEGPPPSPLHEAGHTCPHGEQELCVNPEHLTWMTREENEAWKRVYEEVA
jgi:hypothetical protein